MGASGGPRLDERLVVVRAVLGVRGQGPLLVAVRLADTGGHGQGGAGSRDAPPAFDRTAGQGKGSRRRGPSAAAVCRLRREQAVRGMRDGGGAAGLDQEDVVLVAVGADPRGGRGVADLFAFRAAAAAGQRRGSAECGGERGTAEGGAGRARVRGARACTSSMRHLGTKSNRSRRSEASGTTRSTPLTTRVQLSSVRDAKSASVNGPLRWGGEYQGGRAGLSRSSPQAQRVFGLWGARDAKCCEGAASRSRASSQGFSGSPRFSTMIREGASRSQAIPASSSGGMGLSLKDGTAARTRSGRFCGENGAKGRRGGVSGRCCDAGRGRGAGLLGVDARGRGARTIGGRWDGEGNVKGGKPRLPVVLAEPLLELGVPGELLRHLHGEARGQARGRALLGRFGAEGLALRVDAEGAGRLAGPAAPGRRGEALLRQGRHAGGRRGAKWLARQFGWRQGSPPAAHPRAPAPLGSASGSLLRRHYHNIINRTRSAEVS